MNGGLHTDTITVIAHRKKQSESYRKTNSNSDIPVEMIRNVNLKKMRTDLFVEQKTDTAKQQPPQPVAARPKTFALEDKPAPISFDFNLETMKSKYIFPFNQTFTRKKNNQLKESSDLTDGINISNGNSRMIFESKVFCFPFTHVKVPVTALKELQTPITKSTTDVANVLEEFCLGFPREIFPLRKNKPSSIRPSKSPEKKLPEIRQEQSYVDFLEADIDRVFTQLRSE